MFAARFELFGVHQYRIAKKKNTNEYRLAIEDKRSNKPYGSMVYIGAELTQLHAGLSTWHRSI